MAETTPHHLLCPRSSVFSYPICCVFIAENTSKARYLYISIVEDNKVSA